MICKKLLDCKLAKPDTAPHRRVSKTVVIEEVKQPVEEPVVDTAKKSPDEAREFENQIKPSPIDFTENQFAVETPGKLRKSWSGRVFISKETLSAWGGRIREVAIQTKAGKKMRCKVMPSEDSRKGIILVPEKIQSELEVEKGELVNVEPVILLELKNKARGIVQMLYNFKKKIDLDQILKFASSQAGFNMQLAIHGALKLYFQRVHAHFIDLKTKGWDDCE